MKTGLNSRNNILLCSILLLLSSTTKVHAQHDSLILKNGNSIVGEIKSMDKGVLIIETDYSDKDRGQKIKTLEKTVK